MHHVILYIINFQQNQVSRSVKTVHRNLIAKNHKLHKFATTNINLKKKSSIQTLIIVKTYMYINFQPNQVSRSIKSVHTNLLAKIASCINLQLPIVIKNNYFRQASSDNVHIYFNFHLNRVGNQSKLRSQIYLPKSKLHKFATTNSNLKTIDYFSHASS